MLKIGASSPYNLPLWCHDFWGSTPGYVVWYVIRRGILLACHHELLDKRVKVWAEICLYERASVQPAKEPSILGLIRPGGLAQKGTTICLDKRAGFWPATELGVSGPIRPDGLAPRSHGICLYQSTARPGIWMAISVDNQGGNLAILFAGPQYLAQYTRQFSNLACESCHQYGEVN